MIAPMVAAAAAPATPNSVSELIVTASKQLSELVVPAPMKCLKPDARGGTPLVTPKVISTFPKRGAVVRPGLLILRVTFDQPMTCNGAFAEDNDWAFPCPTLQTMVLSYDRRTVRTVCLVRPGAHYGLWLDRSPGSGDFVSLAGRAPGPHQLDFITSDAAPITTACEAVLQDAETADEVLAKGHKLDCRAP